MTRQQKWSLRKGLKVSFFSNQDEMKERNANVQYTKGCCKEGKNVPSIPLVGRMGGNRL